MATTPLQPGTAPANAPARPLSRRGIIGILATGPIAMLPPMAAYKIGSAEAASPAAWEAALSTYRRLYDAHGAAIDATDAAKAAYHEVRPKGPAPVWTDLSEGAEGHNERIRQAKIAYEKADQECRDRFSVDQADEQQARACFASCDAFDALLATPAPDLQAVILKLELSVEEDSEIEGIKAAVADLRRLAGEA